MAGSGFTESTVEQAALQWLAELGYTVLHGPDIAPNTPHANTVAIARPPRTRDSEFAAAW